VVGFAGSPLSGWVVSAGVMPALRSSRSFVAMPALSLSNASGNACSETTLPRYLAVSINQAVEQRVGGVIDVGPPVCNYLVTAPLVAISTSAVA
jgi:hypothetical protein